MYFFYLTITVYLTLDITEWNTQISFCVNLVGFCFERALSSKLPKTQQSISLLIEQLKPRFFSPCFLVKPMNFYFYNGAKKEAEFPI